jgi:Nucleotidyltransferase domain
MPMSLSPEAQTALDEVLARQDPAILGIVLSGSAARGIATEHSDVDVVVVLTDDAAEGRETSRSPAIDEIPHTLADLEDVPPWGHGEYGYRWGYAYAQVLRDDTGGRISEAVRRQATHTPAEARRMLLEGDQLDGYVNMAYRALKSDRDGRALERRRRPGGVRRHRARVLRLGPTAWRPRPSRPHRGLGRRAGGVARDLAGFTNYATPAHRQS